MKAQTDTNYCTSTVHLPMLTTSNQMLEYSQTAVLSLTKLNPLWLLLELYLNYFRRSISVNVNIHFPLCYAPLTPCQVMDVDAFKNVNRHTHNHNQPSIILTNTIQQLVMSNQAFGL